MKLRRNRKVWVVTSYYDYDPSELVGVFSSRARAEEHAKRAAQEPLGPWSPVLDSVDVHEFKLDDLAYVANQDPSQFDQSLVARFEVPIELPDQPVAAVWEFAEDPLFQFMTCDALVMTSRDEFC